MYPEEEVLVADFELVVLAPELVLDDVEEPEVLDAALEAACEPVAEADPTVDPVAADEVVTEAEPVPTAVVPWLLGLPESKGLITNMTTAAMTAMRATRAIAMSAMFRLVDVGTGSLMTCCS